MERRLNERHIEWGTVRWKAFQMVTLLKGYPFEWKKKRMDGMANGDGFDDTRTKRRPYRMGTMLNGRHIEWKLSEGKFV